MRLAQRALCQVGLVVNVFPSHTVDRGFVYQPGKTYSHDKTDTNSCPALIARMHKGVSLAVQPDSVNLKTR